MNYQWNCNNGHFSHNNEHNPISHLEVRLMTSALKVGRTKMSGHYSSHQEADEPLQTTGHSLRHHWPFTCTAVSAPSLVKPLREANEQLCCINMCWMIVFTMVNNQCTNYLVEQRYLSIYLEHDEDNLKTMLKQC